MEITCFGFIDKDKLLFSKAGIKNQKPGEDIVPDHPTG